MRIFEWPKRRDAVEKFFGRADAPAPEVERAVLDILHAVRRDGDKAVAEFTKKFDGVELRPNKFEVPREELKAAWEATPAKLRAALRLAARRIEAFHKRQRLKGWAVSDPAFGRMELRVEPLDRVAVYAPGGKAAYPSTALMNIIPAKVAGVREVILLTPPGPEGTPNPVILAAAWLAGADRVFRIGGAQGLAAAAYGTKTIPRVDKITGPGNAYVAAAKRMLFGHVDIDSIAGPTEVLILADNDASLEHIAADMLAQAEHGEDSSSGVVLIGGDEARAAALAAEVKRQLAGLSRRAIAEKSIADCGYIIRVASADDAVEIANLKAPEHLEILTADARALSRRVRHAGAIFIGPHSPEALGDYVAGPNHTLPTSGTARFFSPLSVWTFYKTLHTIEATRAGLARLAPAIQTLAEAENLPAHAASVMVRINGGGAAKPAKAPRAREPQRGSLK